MSDRTMMILWAIVTEVVAIIVFGFLAWKFKYWWIALFSIVFMKSLKFGGKDGEVLRWYPIIGGV